MKRGLLFWVLACIINLAICQAQDNQSLKWKYGIAGGIALPQLPDYFDPKIAWKGQLFSSYTQNTKTLFTSLGIRNIDYNNPENYTSVVARDLYAEFGLKSNFGKLSKTNLLINYSPSLILNSTQTYFGIDPQIPRTSSLINEYENTINHSFAAGLELELTDYSSLTLTYQQPLNSIKKQRFVDALPPLLNISYAINFNTFVSKTDKRQLMVSSLLALQKDTLYIINRDCKDNITKNQLDSLWKENFKFSAFRIIDDHEISAIKNRKNSIHFAVFGNYYAGTGEPNSSGIYLLDKNLTNVEYPYPTFTRITGGTSRCFGSSESIAVGITIFSNRLNKKLN